MLLCSFFAHVLSIAGAGFVCYLIAYILSRVPNCMSWYSKPWLLIPIYILPAIAVVFAVHAVIFKMIIAPRFANSNFAVKCEASYDVSFDAALIIGAVGVAVLTIFQFASSYVLCIWIGIPLLGSLGMDHFIPLAKKSRANSPTALLFRHFFLTSVPSLYFLYITDPIFDIFIPITGRIGSAANPEYMLAVISVGTIAILLLFHVSVNFQRLTFKISVATIEHHRLPDWWTYFAHSGNYGYFLWIYDYNCYFDTIWASLQCNFVAWSGASSAFGDTTDNATNISFIEQ